MKYLSLVLVFALVGCAFQRSLYVKLECHDCRTPYGGGQLVNIVVNKTVSTCR